jgi:hypothetical protein
MTKPQRYGVSSMPCDQGLYVLHKDYLALEAEVRALREDANRWRAFINCARVRLFGWAGYGSTKGGQVREPDSNGYRHFGAEFWTIYDAPSDSMAQEILTGFADAAAAIDAARGAK